MTVKEKYLIVQVLEKVHDSLSYDDLMSGESPHFSSSEDLTLVLDDSQKSQLNKIIKKLIMKKYKFELGLHNSIVVSTTKTFEKFDLNDFLDEAGDFDSGLISTTSSEWLEWEENIYRFGDGFASALETDGTDELDVYHSLEEHINPMAERDVDFIKWRFNGNPSKIVEYLFPTFHAKGWTISSVSRNGEEVLEVQKIDEPEMFFEYEPVNGIPKELHDDFEAKKFAIDFGFEFDEESDFHNNTFKITGFTND